MQTPSYTIDSHGFFKTTGKSTHVIVEVEENYIPYSGDNLLYVYCTRGTIHVELDGSEQLIYHGMPTVRFFEGGLPMAGQYAGKVWVRKSSQEAQIYAVFENYPEEDRRGLCYYSSLYDQNRGVKLRDSSSFGRALSTDRQSSGDQRDGAIYQVVGRNNGTPMLERLNSD